VDLLLDLGLIRSDRMKKHTPDNLIILFCLLLIQVSIPVSAQRQMENLNRGVIAFNQGNGNVYIGWRMLGTDSNDLSFNVYRSTNDGKAVKINSSPVTNCTNIVNSGVNLALTNAYFVKPVLNGIEQAASEVYTLKSNAPVQQYLSIPIKDGSAVYSQSSIGDIDGDGEYEIIFKWSTSVGTDPGVHTTGTATVYIDAYKLNGKFLWRIDLGWNLEPGSDFTPLLVYDMDGDGKAEIITKTAEGTIDGTGVVIGDTNNDGKTDYRNTDGRVLSGPEFMSVFSGQDGHERLRTNWIARGSVSDWGDTSGNRSCRNQIGVAYIDGVRPSIVMSRGVYAYQVMETWNFRNNKLSKIWSWDNGGKGQSGEWHSSAQCLRMADCDGDGRDEIVKGSLVVDHDGKMLWDLGLIKGHGDYTHIGVLDPSKSGLQIYRILEAAQPNGVAMMDAKTGSILWGKTIAGDAGRGYCAHIDPRQNGVQCWAGQINNNLLNFDGSVLATTGPQASGFFAPIWWDNGLCRSLTDEHSGTDGVHILKWNYENNTSTRFLTAGTGTRTIVFIGDILGDWREELVIFQPNEIRVYSTTIPATNKIYTLMHDPLYKLNVGQWAQRNASPSNPSFYLGTGMGTPPTPNIYLVKSNEVQPEVSFILPSNGSKYSSGADITLFASAAAFDTTIREVAFYSDTTLLGIDSIPSSYSVIWKNVPAGNYTLKAVAIDERGNKGSSSTIQITVNLRPQSISFDEIDTKTNRDSTFHLIARSSSGLKVLFTSSNQNVATISDSTVTIKGLGTSTITASQIGNTYFSAAPDVVRTLTVQSATSVKPVEKEKQVGIYPNPVSDLLNITNLDPLKTHQVILEALNGSTIRTLKVMDASQIKMNLSSLSPGIYLLKIFMNDTVRIEKIVKN